jgi:hypothetical protein
LDKVAHHFGQRLGKTRAALLRAGLAGPRPRVRGGLFEDVGFGGHRAAFRTGPHWDRARAEDGKGEIEAIPRHGRQADEDASNPPAGVRNQRDAERIRVGTHCVTLEPSRPRRQRRRTGAENNSAERG